MPGSVVAAQLGGWPVSATSPTSSNIELNTLVVGIIATRGARVALVVQWRHSLAEATLKKTHADLIAPKTDGQPQ